MSWASSALSATISVRSCCLTGNNSLASICSTERLSRSGNRREVLKRLAQHLEQYRRRPAEHQNTVHRGHRSLQPPRFHGSNVAVAERCVVDEGEIQDIAAGGRWTDERIRPCPDEDFKGVRPHQHRRRP